MVNRHRQTRTNSLDLRHADNASIPSLPAAAPATASPAPETPAPFPLQTELTSPNALLAAAQTPAAKQPWLRRHKLGVMLPTVVAALLAGAFGIWALWRTPTPVATTIIAKLSSSPTPVPTPITKASPLTGLQVDPAVASQPIAGVIIENHPDARPQSGLADAGIVYEANAEGGITRFEAFYLDKIPATLGPVRSLRTYFLDWGLEMNAPIAHAGGNADALDLVDPLGLKDINALTNAYASFYRTTDRVAPHNLYITNTKLQTLLATLGYNTPASFTPSPRKVDTPPPTAPHPKIHIDFSYSGYQVDYTYAPATNDYLRNLAGAPHIDRNTGQQIHVKNIVVEMMPTAYGTTRMGEATVIMQTVGEGKGWVIRDGDVIPITWKKTSHTSHTQLLGADGQEVPLDAGNTWYSIVPVGNTVAF